MPTKCPLKVPVGPIEPVGPVGPVDPGPPDPPDPEPAGPVGPIGPGTELIIMGGHPDALLLHPFLDAK